ncbi:hypothetical protein RCL_jg26857.t1 [Rhizophagus clarus]|uniref:Uncharacterized protein n=1 Tax=Rhizophagus clarus TaxID=94130 RepID=A0A8H3LDL8_9GLOM|nr:hypothetical protein RCL_jg26857.t1 [Rhizophagus clarus]
MLFQSYFDVVSVLGHLKSQNTSKFPVSVYYISIITREGDLDFFSFGAYRSLILTVNKFAASNPCSTRRFSASVRLPTIDH